jgi:hypothetical protein
MTRLSFSQRLRDVLTNTNTVINDNFIINANKSHRQIQGLSATWINGSSGRGASGSKHLDLPVEEARSRNFTLRVRPCARLGAKGLCFMAWLCNKRQSLHFQYSPHEWVVLWSVLNTIPKSGAHPCGDLASLSRLSCFAMEPRANR